mmetsp:Transcript_16634/g.47354  ORF Transcript_16634/g.47354 Transcript_16634/m.47354 type:complete len:104 (+) Transcript_16634:62-373(+)
MRALWRFLFVLSVFKAVVHAQDDGDEDDEDESPEAIMKQVDKNKDGKISIEELLEQAQDDKDIALAKKLFKQSDKDGDDMIGPDELPELIKLVNDEMIEDDEM